MRALPSPGSLRGRVTVGVLVLLSVLLVLLFVAVDVLLGARLHADLRTRLTDRAALAQQLDGSLSSQQLVDQLRGDGVTAQLCAYGAGCVTADPAPVPPGAPRPAPPSSRSGPAPAVVRAPATVERSGTTLYVRTTLADGQQLTLTVDDSDVTSALHRLVVLEGVGGLLALLMAGLLLGRVVGAALRPLDRMTTLARDIAAGDRGRRLRSGPGVRARQDTELGRTAAAFDAMLDELELALATAHAAQVRMRAFLSDASHELRTPLAGLQATAENLLRGTPDRLELERSLAAVVRESARAARLVDDLLVVSRLDEQVPLQPQVFDLTELVSHEVERHRLLARSVRWHEESTGPALVTADPVRVGQVLSNLLDNAAYATPAGGIVTVSVSTTAQDLVLDVADTGPGIAVADQERVFDRLVRLDAARSRRSGGAGLGLPIARAYARAHGGELSCVSGEGEGARFRLVLPRDRAVGPAPSSPTSRSGELCS